MQHVKSASEIGSNVSKVSKVLKPTLNSLSQSLTADAGNAPALCEMQLQTTHQENNGNNGNGGGPSLIQGTKSEPMPHKKMSTKQTKCESLCDIYS
eukprot:UN08891